jgi:hypothetical protein
MFENESEKVIRKAKAREVSKIKQVSTTSANHSQVGSPTVAAERNDRFAVSLTSFHSLTPTVEERAIGFFFSNLVTNLFGPSQDSLDYIPALSNKNDMDEHLFASMRAVGLAGFSNVVNSPELMKEARRDYLASLQLVNTALRSQVDVKKDSTLLAVMILSIFETVTGFNHRSLKAWAEHIHGAAALVKLRGHEQLRSRKGLRLFKQVAASLLMSCVHRELAIPADILELRTAASSYIDTSEPAWRLQGIIIAFASFRASLKDGSFSDLESILAAAIEIDGAFLSLFSSTPAAWKYEVAFTDSNPNLVLDGCYHVYQDYGVAQIWNSMRACRILVNRAIRDVLLKGFSARPPVFVASEYTAQFQISTDVLFQLCADILASVPQYIGYSSKPPWLSAPFDTSPLASFGASSKHPHLQAYDQIAGDRASGGYFLLWPLYLVGSMDISTEPIRLWVINLLQFIGRSEGIQLAIALAGLLEERGKIQAWWSNLQPPPKK